MAAADKRPRGAVSAAARARKRSRALPPGTFGSAPAVGEPASSLSGPLRPGIRRRERNVAQQGRAAAEARPTSSKTRPESGPAAKDSDGGDAPAAARPLKVKGSHLPPPTDVAAVLGSRLLDRGRSVQRGPSTPSYIAESKEMAAPEFWQARHSVVLSAMQDLDKLEERIRLLA